MIFISVISHNHSSLIKKLKCVSSIAREQVTLVVKSNMPEDLNEYLKGIKVHYIGEQYGLGFGHNNNYVFNHCVKYLGMTRDDYFVILNPDVIIAYADLVELISSMKANGDVIASINLFKDDKFTIPDFSIRKFPRLYDFFSSFIGYANKSILNKSAMFNRTEVDWAAGSFIAFQSFHYAKLKGFDERYFMYCEDIDICYRSAKFGRRLVYYPNIYAIHLAKHQNRKLFSSHFIWHITSAFRFCFSKYFATIVRSSIKPIDLSK